MELAICCHLHAGFLLHFLFNPEDAGDMFLQNVSSLSTDYYGLMSQKIEFFIITTVRTSNPTFLLLLCRITYVWDII
jgi:hypothetical protein